MELTINVGDFYVRVPNMQTRHYKFKIYDDAFKAPMVKHGDMDGRERGGRVLERRSRYFE